MGSVSDKGCALFHEGSYDDFACFAVGEVFACYGVYNFYVYKVVPVVHTAVIFAVYTDTRTVDFGKTINVIEFYTEFCCDSLTHFVAPAFRTDNALFEFYFILADTSFLYFLGKKKCI